MSSLRISLTAAIVLLPLSAAEPGKSGQSGNPEVVLPVMKVPATRLERFGMMQQGGSVGTRLLVWHVPAKSDMFRMLIGGAQVGDEIVSIDGRDVATIPTHQHQSMLRGYFKIVVRRPAGRRSFKLLELDGRGD